MVLFIRANSLFILGSYLPWVLKVYRVMVDTIALLFLLYHLGHSLQYFVVVGPLVSHQLRRDQNIENVYLKRPYPRKHYLLISVLIHENVFLVVQFWSFDQFVGDGVFDDDGVGYEFLYFSFDCVIMCLR